MALTAATSAEGSAKSASFFFGKESYTHRGSNAGLSEAAREGPGLGPPATHREELLGLGHEALHVRAAQLDRQLA